MRARLGSRLVEERAAAPERNGAAPAEWAAVRQRALPFRGKEARMTGSATARIKVLETARPKQIGIYLLPEPPDFPAGEQSSPGPILGSAELRPAACPQFAPTLWTCPIESPSCSARASSASHAPKRRGMAGNALDHCLRSLLSANASRFKIDYRGVQRAAPLKSHRGYDAGPTQTRRGGRKILTLQGALGSWAADVSRAANRSFGSTPAGSIAAPRTTGSGADRPIRRRSTNAEDCPTADLDVGRNQPAMLGDGMDPPGASTSLFAITDGPVHASRCRTSHTKLSGHALSGRSRL